jgi:hypothetical protein
MAASFRKTIDNLQRVAIGLDALTRLDLLVGVTKETAGRGEDISNADLAYIHENGVPDRNIPARPFMRPGVRKARSKIAARMKEAGQAAIAGKAAKMQAQYEACGMEVVSEMQNTISEGIPPPLKDATVKNRWRQRGKGYKAGMRPAEKSYIEARKAGVSAEKLTTLAGNFDSYGLVTPLINTGQLLKSLTYAVRLNKNE